MEVGSAEQSRPRRNRVEETLISSLIEAEREWRTASSPMSKC
jgi:hypothetical protein